MIKRFSTLHACTVWRFGLGKSHTMQHASCAHVVCNHSVYMALGFGLAQEHSGLRTVLHVEEWASN
jgi:hypothetical protein